MCLINLKPVTTRKRTGYVWMQKNKNNEFTSILGNHREYKIGVKYEAHNEFDESTMMPTRGYTPGFHIFLNPIDAIKFKFYSRWRCTYYLVKVKFREPITEGYAADWSTGIHTFPAIVTKYRTIIKEIIETEITKGKELDL